MNNPMRIEQGREVGGGGKDTGLDGVLGYEAQAE